jgi:hypothetical protein
LALLGFSTPEGVHNRTGRHPNGPQIVNPNGLKELVPPAEEL